MSTNDAHVLVGVVASRKCPEPGLMIHVGLMIIIVDSYKAHIPSSKMLVALFRFNRNIHDMYNKQKTYSLHINYETKQKVYAEKTTKTTRFFNFIVVVD